MGRHTMSQRNAPPSATLATWNSADECEPPEEEIGTKPSMYRPNELLDLVKAQLALKNDVALAHTLGVLPSTISNIRHERLLIGDYILVRIHEEIGLSIRELKRLYIPGSPPKIKANISPARRQEPELKSIEPPAAPDANRVLDMAIRKLGLKSDRALSRALGVPQPLISNLRHGRILLGPAMLLRLHEATGVSTRELKNI